MKVIDLLNKIANREEVPKKIEYEGEIYEFNKNIHGYWGGKNKDSFRAMVNWRYLNNEVEILEEEKKIPEKLNLYYHINNDVEEETGETTFNDLCDIIGNLRKHEDTINSIIDYLKSKEKGE